MNAKEMEALIIKQGEMIQAAQEAHMHLVQRADNIVEGFKQELAGRDKVIEGLTADVSNHHNRLALIEERHVEAFTDFQHELVDRDVRLADYSARIEKLETLVLARNASAATKRNMTDEDALRVLTGDLRDVAHKDAAEKIGLTYAQVYSCRLEFTFKHVHKDLRDNVKEWKNPWAK